MKQLPSGTPAPDFELKTLNGRALRLSTLLEESPVVLVFYKASCPTCQFAMPYLQKIHSESRARLLAIAQDDESETKEFIEHFGVTFDVVIDEHPYEVSAAYNLEYVPAIFMVGSDGMIKLSDYGFGKATLSAIAGQEMFQPGDGIPATRPG
jgi:peroxiredoxin